MTTKIQLADQVKGYFSRELILKTMLAVSGLVAGVALLFFKGNLVLPILGGCLIGTALFALYHNYQTYQFYMEIGTKMSEYASIVKAVGKVESKLEHAASFFFKFF